MIGEWLCIVDYFGCSDTWSSLMQYSFIEYEIQRFSVSYAQEDFKESSW